MKRLKIIPIFIVFLFANYSIKADEGMWIPLLLEQLNMNDMQAKGLKLSAEDIYAINQSSLKDAVVRFGGGCTSEIISSGGLLLTNHHCGYGVIQSHSSVENDYLTDGFWAMSQKEELSNPGLTATFIVRIEDVTKKVLEGVDDKTEESARQKAIRANIKKVREEATKDTHYEALIRPFYYGNEYYMFITETFKDIRLVGAPPSSIGKYGGDTDNWMWPRHTGDFALFRIYADKDNKPAEYAEDNIPFKPRHYFPISLTGIKENDFTMIYGFPGRTTEYLTSYAVDYIMNVSNPARIKMREVSLAIIEADMRSSDEIRIKYATKQGRISNYHKKWIGENRGLRRLNAIEKKKELEAQFTKQLELYPPYRERYGALLGEYEKQYKDLKKYALARDYFIELVYYGPEMIRYASRYQNIVELSLSKGVSNETLQTKIEKLKKSAKGFFKNYNMPTDRKLFAALLKAYYNGIDKSMCPGALKEVESKFKGDFNKYAEYVYGKSMLVTEERVNAMLDKFSASTAKKLRKDPLYAMMESIYYNYYSGAKVYYDKINKEIDRMNRTYMLGLKELLKDRKYYPDANGTLRISHGKVEGYNPKDAVEYAHYTTLRGIMEKADPDDDEFKVPPKLAALYENKDYGQYAQDGELWVCFIASNHTTGGNSGSPVLNADGHLTGINFDRGWEGTMSDIMFDPERCRNISVDIRYVLFIIDKFAGAGYLLDEMKLVTNKPLLKVPNENIKQ